MSAAPMFRSVVLASVLGTVVEWYDFLVYGTAAALVFGKLFFPAADPAVGTIASLGAYAVGFVARPLGGAMFGHYGDRLGRKTMLMLTMLIMGAGTFLIGCLPTYARSASGRRYCWSSLRLMQGIGIGGEWGGAVLMVVENAPHRSRGLFGSLVQLGYPLGPDGGDGAFALMQLLPPDDFLAWGWRVPFLVSALLVGVALFVRLRLAENAGLRQLRAAGATARVPLLEVLGRHRRGVPDRRRPEGFRNRLGEHPDGILYRLRDRHVTSAGNGDHQRHPVGRRGGAGHHAAGRLAVGPRRAASRYISPARCSRSRRRFRCSGCSTRATR